MGLNSKAAAQRVRKRNAAVKSWDNGHFFSSFYIPNETRPLSRGITAVFFNSFYIPNELRPLSRGITAVF